MFKLNRESLFILISLTIIMNLMNMDEEYSVGILLYSFAVRKWKLKSTANVYK